MSWNDGLTGIALEIAETESSPLRVMAGPGTGKSFAMKRRVARLLEDGQDPDRILAVTFTRNAAASLVEDLKGLGIPGCEAIHSGTVHAYCFSLLNREHVFQFLNRVPRPLVTFSSRAGTLQFEGGPLIADLVRLKVFGKRRDCSKRVIAYEAGWARLQSEEPGWAENPVDQQFQDSLLSWLRFHRGMLIGELVPEALRFLRSNPLAEDLSAFDHVLVDEYQDLNKAEQALVDLISKKGNLAVVGDVDQSIYSFRHANPEGIATFDEYHPSTDDKTLDVCRRCPTHVVQIANDLIRNNYPGESERRLNPKADNVEGDVQIIQWPNVAEEIEGIAKLVSFLLKERGYEAGDIMILTPRRRLAYRIRDEIQRLNIPIHSFYNDEALEGESAQRAFAIMTLLANPYDRVALRWWLGNGSDNFLSGQYVKLRAYCEKENTEPKDALDAVVNGELKLAGTNVIISRYKELVCHQQEYANTSVSDLVDALLPESNDELAALRGVAGHALVYENIEKISDLLDSVQKFVTQPEMPQEGAFVRIMSLHKSKGLTCKVAIVVGCLQGLIPYFDDADSTEAAEASLREQRRLFYVAITRCTDMLVLSSITGMERSFAHQIGLTLPDGKSYLGRTTASQFIHELGPQAPKAKSGNEWVNSGFN